MHMKRTTILADERLLAEIGALARRRGITTSHAVREALEQYVADEQAQERPLPDLVGMFDWEGEPTGEHAEETLERDWPTALTPQDVPSKAAGRA